MRAIALAMGMAFAVPAVQATSVDFRDMSFAEREGPRVISIQRRWGPNHFVNQPAGRRALVGPKDGFGVTSPSSYEADEIEGPEKLFVSFSNPVTLTQFSVSDLFYEHGYYEMGFYDVEDQGTSTDFLQRRAQTMGSVPST